MNDGLGVWLRRARESRQLSLEDVEHTLKIRRRYLQALEMGDYAALPGEIQARGFLRNYARYLGLPMDEALERYNSEVQGRPMQPRARVRKVESHRQPIADRPSVFAPPPSEEEESGSAANSFPAEMVMMVLLALLGMMMLIFVISFLWLQFGVRNTAPPPPLTPTASMLIPEQTPAAPPMETLVATPAFPVAADGTINVRLVPSEHAWISIASEERIIFQDIAPPDQVLEASSQGMLIVATGNGGAFRLYINGTDWGMLGGQGVAVRRAWTPTGEYPMEGP